MRVISIMGDRDRRDSCASNVSRREDVNSLPYFYNNFKSTDEVKDLYIWLFKSSVYVCVFQLS